MEKWVSPAAMPGRSSAFCSAVPPAMMAGPTVFTVRKGTGTPATAASSVKISWSSMGRAWPPNSSGQPMASHPSLPRVRVISL